MLFPIQLNIEVHERNPSRRAAVFHASDGAEEFLSPFVWKDSFDCSKIAAATTAASAACSPKLLDSDPIGASERSRSRYPVSILAVRNPSSRKTLRNRL